MSDQGREETIDLSMLELFRTEVENYTKLLETGLVEAEHDQRPEKIEPLMRAAHSIKGAARMVGLDLVVTLAHAMEDVLSAAHQGKRTLCGDDVERLLKGNDLFLRLSQTDIPLIPEWLLAQSEKISILSGNILSILSSESAPAPAGKKERRDPAEMSTAVPPGAGSGVEKASPEPTSNDSTEVVDVSMLELFRTEVENYTKLLEKGLVEVEQDQRPEKIEPLMRAAHSIKGAARMVGLDLVVTLAHAMEDVLSASQHGKVALGPDHIDTLLAGNDLFLQLAKTDIPIIPEWLRGQSEEISSLSRRILAGLASEPGRTPVEKPQAPAKPERGAVPGGEVRESTHRRRSSDKEEKGLVRVVSDSLDRLLGYAGECLVQAKSAKPFFTSLLSIKEDHREVSSGLEDLHGLAKSMSLPKEIEERMLEYLERMDRMRERLAAHLVDFEIFSRGLERLADKLYEEVVAIRMRPFSDGVTGFPRMVRDIAKSLAKKVDFQIVGESTRVDRDMMERLEAPLVHLLRNALDHGLEPPEERIAAGKSAAGKLTIEARHSSGMLQIRVADDGRGINKEGIRRKVVEKGHVSAEMAAGLTETELLDFLFLPGFSTSPNVTEVSGRGVGLDVVLSMVQETGGSVRVETKQGSGTTFSLQLPITLSVLRALLVDIAAQPYAIPLSRIDRLIKCNPQELRTLEDKQFYTCEDEHVGIVEGSQVMDLPGTNGPKEKICIVIISDRLNRYGLVVDRFLDRRDVVVMPLDPRLGRIPNVSAGAILEDGSPVLILDVDDLVRSIDNLLTHGRLYKVGGQKARGELSKKHVLVVDDSLTVREVERRLLENSGYLVSVAVDGMDGWNTLQLEEFDLVVSDVDMPRMNGIELIKKIKSDSRLKDTPVIIVSYKDREEDRLRGLEAGADYYLTKSSFQDEGLNNAVRDLIGEA
ncbi:MAG: hybrid sensor histidine kinase/response regulator [Desulfobacteraceae bacterium]|nr:MAG: hybrid sensor histidine kinase/response regulator [Desulfobacteraceae bacterium]